MRPIVLLLFLHWVSFSDAFSARSFLDLMFKPAGRSRSFKWAGMGNYFVPSHMPPRPAFIPKWIPGAKSAYSVKWVPTIPSSHSVASPKKTDAFYGFGAPKQNSVVNPQILSALYNIQQYRKSDNISNPISVPPKNVNQNNIKSTGVIKIPQGESSVILGSSIRTPKEIVHDFNTPIGSESTQYRSFKKPTTFIGSLSNYKPEDQNTLSSNSLFIKGSKSENQYKDEFSYPKQEDEILVPSAQNLKYSVLSASLSNYSVTDLRQERDDNFIQTTPEQTYNQIPNQQYEYISDQNSELEENNEIIYENSGETYDYESENEIFFDDSNLSDDFESVPEKDVDILIENSDLSNNIIDSPSNYRDIVVSSSFYANDKPNFEKTEADNENNNNNNFESQRSSFQQQEESTRDQEGVASILIVHPPAVTSNIIFGNKETKSYSKTPNNGFERRSMNAQIPPLDSIWNHKENQFRPYYSKLIQKHANTQF